MKIHTILIGVLIILCAFLFLDRSCTARKLDIAKGNHENQKIVTAEVQLEADKNIAGLVEKLSKRDDKIESLHTEIRKKVLVDVEEERKIEELEAEEIVLVDKDEIIDNLHSQISGWKERFTLVSGIVEDQKKIIFSLTEKYDIQVKITLEVENKLKSEKALRISAENVIKEATKEIRVLKFKSKLKTGGIALVAVVLAYSVLR